ncbi:redoxin family protein [Nannocystaceae bacterium ST9]
MASSRAFSCMLLTLVACGEAEFDATPASAPEVRGPMDLEGRVVDPLALDGQPDLILFLRTDCPISNRYAPEIGRIAARFGEQVDVWLVYVDPDETPAIVRRHVADYALPGTPLLDPDQTLVARAGVEVTPEAALFDGEGQRRYRGRIDDRQVAYGKARAQPTTHELIDALAALLAGQPPTIDHAPAIGCPLPRLPDAPRGAPL